KKARTVASEVGGGLNLLADVRLRTQEAAPAAPYSDVAEMDRITRRGLTIQPENAGRNDVEEKGSGPGSRAGVPDEIASCRLHGVVPAYSVLGRLWNSREWLCEALGIRRSAAARRPGAAVAL